MKNDKMVRFLKNIMVLIAVLPLLGSCIREDEVANSPQGNFEALWKIIDEQYCFLEYKQIDWNAIHDEYSRLITGSMSSEGLFEVLGNMLNELQDGHPPTMFRITMPGIRTIRATSAKTLWKTSIWARRVPTTALPQVSSTRYSKTTSAICVTRVSLRA